jgi:hypothetical protein
MPRPVVTIILDDAKAIDPDILDTELAGSGDTVLKGSGEF